MNFSCFYSILLGQFHSQKVRNEGGAIPFTEESYVLSQAIKILIQNKTALLTLFRAYFPPSLLHQHSQSVFFQLSFERRLCFAPLLNERMPGTESNSGHCLAMKDTQHASSSLVMTIQCNIIVYCKTSFFSCIQWMHVLPVN